MDLQKIQALKPLGGAERKRCPDGQLKGKLESENIQKLVVLVDCWQMGVEEGRQGT